MDKYMDIRIYIYMYSKKYKKNIIYYLIILYI